jgi:ABC-type transport system involved in multi-copper enzyme maturation permease subunit
MKDISINVLYMLPEYLIILFFGLFISTIVSNNGSSVICGIGLFIGSSIINDLIISNSIKYLYCVPTMCWDLRNGINSIRFNIIICIVTVLILMIFTFIIFNNKEIRNA